MNAGNLLRASEASALSNIQFVSNVKGKKLKKTAGKKKFSFSLMFLITLMIGVFAALFASGNLIPSAISERILEETDVQYADAVESKIIVFAEAMKAGDLPTNTKKKLEENGVKAVDNSDGSVSLTVGDKTISGSEFYDEVHNNTKLYSAFTSATYGRAAYYYDSAAQETFRRIGTSRNNYTKDSNFDETMNKIMGEGSDISTNNVTLVKRVVEENGETKTYYEYVETTPAASSKNSVEDYINSILNKGLASSRELAISNVTTSLNVADTISKEQRSSLFFLALMENISKMKAGEGGESKINEVMSYLNKSTKTSVVDVETGEIIEVSGSPLESPSLYAILAKEPVNTSKVKNYASDRVAYTIDNKTKVSSNPKSVVVSSSSRSRGNIGIYKTGDEKASYEDVSSVSSTIDKSLINNSYYTISGIEAGEMLVEGAVNVGKELAKASGATPGSEEAVKSYARLTTKILAMDAEVDRMNRSPFDITSKNTFLGSIIYNFAIHLKPYNFISQFSSISSAVSSSIISLFPTTYAADETTRFLGNFGECKTTNLIGAAGSAHCSEIATFDTSTLSNIFSDAGFIDFLNKNTTVSDGVRTVNKDSTLEKFINFNNKRTTPLGILDGTILSALKTSSFTSGLSSITNMIKSLLNSSDTEKRIATGEAFVNSSSNPDWQTYKYAQRYVSLARATASLKEFSGDSAAYSSATLALSLH